MGVVWAARDVKSGRDVALKFLRDDASSDGKARERFLREARAAMAVVHPHVAKVDAVLETDVGVPFLVMELLEGMSMRDLLRKRRALSPIDAARLLLPIIDAVQAAHAARIVHRDLKPENVFLVNGTDVRVLDFGIAKRLPASPDATATALTTTGAMIGTPVYMAPEQIFGDVIDASTDVWALGIILYECIAGRRPTDAEGFGPIIKRITVDPIEPLERAQPSCPPMLARLVGRMLIRDRSARPTLTDVRATLALVAESTAPISHEPAPDTRRIGPSPTETTAPRPAPLPTLPTPQAIAPKPKGLLEQNVMLVAIGGGLAFVVVIIAVSVAIATAALNKEKLTDPAPAPSASATLGPKARSDQGLALLDEARAKMEARDGAACLQKLDRHDEISLVFKTNEQGGLYSDIRAKCLLLAGRYTEGKAMLRRWLEKNHISTTPIEDRLEVLVGEQYEGTELTPREAIFRARWRLKSMPQPTTAQCDEWFASLEKLMKENPSRGLLDQEYAQVATERPTLLGECRARAR